MSVGVRVRLEEFLHFKPNQRSNTLYAQTHTQTQYAQVAELVDALVSNTNVFTDVPVRPRPWVLT